MKVKVYSTPSCPWCRTVKEFLKNHNIEFEDIDVSVDQDAAKEMVLKSGQMGVPVIEIDENIVVGFNKPLLEELLGLNKNEVSPEERE
ncbi:glutathione S-transferase N-terminal domain-containing protein [bacterium]|nr:glutathione S-transferase N-terminal domain-containing protein [bacterium]